MKDVQEQTLYSQKYCSSLRKAEEKVILDFIIKYYDEENYVYRSDITEAIVVSFLVSLKVS